MSASRIAYTAFVAFVSVLATLVVINWLQGDADEAVRADTGPGDAVFTLDQLADNDSLDSCWKAIDGVIYDVTQYIPRHPTDESVFIEWCGRDATEGWYNKTPGRPHSPRATAMLADYRIGVLGDYEAVAEAPRTEPEPEPEPEAEPERAPSTAPQTMERQWGEAMLAIAPGTYLDGVYRGNFIDRGHIQVSLQFELRDGHIHDLQYRHLYYRGVDYLDLPEDHELQPVFEQHQQIIEALEGAPLTDIFRLYEPENVVDDIDGYTGATLRGAKIMYAIRDGLNLGVYRWR